VLIFVARLGAELAWSELVGAAMLAGVVVLAVGRAGWTGHLATWLPAPLVYGLLAGAVLPFVVGAFAAGTQAPVIVGAGLVAWIAARRLTEPRVPAVLVAVAATLLATALRGQFGPAPDELALPALRLTTPTLSPAAVLTATPVIVVLVAVQANVPSLVYLRSQGYSPPDRAIETTSGLGTAIGSLFGPIGVSLSLPASALCAAPEAGPHDQRHRAAVLAGAGAVVIGLLGGLAPAMAQLVPDVALATIVGLALLGVLTTAVQRAVRGPLVLGPVVAMVVALSDLRLLGLGAFFWAIVLGLVTSRVLERDHWPTASERPDPPAEPVPAG
jgi:benzoate membrane transport protein